MRTPLDPYAGCDPIVDKMIGSSYKIVHEVQQNLKEIRYVAAHMEDIHSVAVGTVRSQVLLTAFVLGDITEIDLPEDLAIEHIQSVSVIIIRIVGGEKIFSPAEDSFKWKIENGKVVVTLADPVPFDPASSTIKCLITYQVVGP